MNILMVHPHDIFSPSEPWTIRIVSLARAFAKKGHRVSLVFFPLDDRGLKPAGLEPGIEAIPFCRRLGLWALLKNTVRMTGLARRSDVVHFQKCFYHAALPAVIAARLTGKPLHYDWDDWELKIFEVSTVPGLLRDLVMKFIGFLENTLPRISDTVSVASKRLECETLKLGVRKEFVFEAHVGADTARFRPDVGGERIREKYGIAKPLVLYLGQLHGGQYVELFIEAAAILTKEFGRDAAFMIVGDGYRAQELKKLGGELGLNGRLTFTGSVPHAEVPEYVACADICVACFQDNQVTACKSPLKIVEYLASGKAIVASNVGEVPNMLSGCGVIVPPGQARPLAEAVANLLDNGDLRRALGRAARGMAETEYNWTVTADNLLMAYKKGTEAA